jgi:hypothetical protein
MCDLCLHHHTCFVSCNLHTNTPDRSSEFLRLPGIPRRGLSHKESSNSSSSKDMVHIYVRWGVVNAHGDGCFHAGGRVKGHYVTVEQKKGTTINHATPKHKRRNKERWRKSKTTANFETTIQPPGAQSGNPSSMNTSPDPGFQ